MRKEGRHVRPGAACYRRRRRTTPPPRNHRSHCPKIRRLASIRVVCPLMCRRRTCRQSSNVLPAWDKSTSVTQKGSRTAVSPSISRRCQWSMASSACSVSLRCQATCWSWRKTTSRYNGSFFWPKSGLVVLVQRVGSSVPRRWPLPSHRHRVLSGRHRCLPPHPRRKGVKNPRGMRDPPAATFLMTSSPTPRRDVC